MGRRYFTDDWKRDWDDERPRRRKRFRLLPMLLMIIGACTVFVLVARYVVVPLLVYLGGLQ